MVTRAYAVSIENKNIDIDKYSGYISSEKRDAINKCVIKQQAITRLVSELLIRHIIHKDTGLSNKDISFSKAEKSKPFLVNKPEYHFNISHSGNWIFIGTSNTPIGVDVEQINVSRNINSIAKRIFAAQEYALFQSGNHIDKLDYFFKVWTLKESYTKAIGEGLSKSFKSFSFDISNINDIKFYSNNDKRDWFFRVYNIAENYHFALCSQSHTLPSSITVIGIDHLLSNISKMDKI